MHRSSALAFLLAAPCLACLAPYAPPPAPSTSLEVHLAPEDRALLERLVAGLTREGREVVPAPAPERKVGARPALRADTRNQLVTQGPVTLATYSSGRPMFEGTQIEGPGGWQRHGPWRAWHPDGKPWEEGAYDHELPHGPWRWWYEDGSLQATGTFERGRRVGDWVYYHPNGKPWAEGRHDDDRPVGLWRVYDESGALLSETDHGTR